METALAIIGVLVAVIIAAGVGMARDHIKEVDEW